MNLYLHPELKKYFSKTAPLFDQVMALKGVRFREQDGRLTQRVLLGEKYYFIKQHFGVGLREIIKNIVQFRLPIVSAKQEEQAILHLQSLGIGTATVVGCGVRGLNPASLQSFILMEELWSVISLEDLCASWKKSPPTFAFKKKLIEEIAKVAHIMHNNGVNHRDFYLCHFLLQLTPFKLYLIDLHRAQVRSMIPSRWIIKDLAGLYFSSKDIGLTRRDFYRFMQVYCQASLREIIKSQLAFWQKVQTRGERLYSEHAK